MRRLHLFRLLLVAVSVSFVLSTWLVAMATLRAVAPATDHAAQPSSTRLLQFFSDQGTTVLAIELLLMALCAVGVFAGERRGATDVSARGRDPSGEDRGPVDR